ncbi:TauD/TfdA dioxygenase family protein [Rhodopirellula sp. MGV]|uniref:TauD/TfdA dioxygenase family protein n=1 Tax=Rhodopirellula sp. MGV TaxID=2023130 RepID=UPI000B976A65|nr:TauD/TfdA family dioxygenase [Rhodopirellula sp. MGV]OYP36084.1 taurine catabolism dioxygenase [Rhodopirellula sp. MGV]PNY36559.1 TauD/TfdA family dioxygenase [Rhodopirellula baltica]
MSAVQSLRIDAPPADQIGAVISGIDVNELVPDSSEITAIREAIYRYRLVVIRGQQMNESQYVEIARKLGRPQVYFQTNYHHPSYPEIFVSSNIAENGQKVGVARTGHYWHTDCSFEQHPLSWTSIYPQVFPQDARGTLYIDMAKVYRELPEHLKAYVDHATTIHAGQLRYKVQASDIDRSLKELLDRINEEVPPVRHPAVIEHPVTGERILYLNSGFTVAIEGMTFEENRERLAELFEYIERPEHIHEHAWSEGDLIIWDNRFLIHMSTAVKPGQQSKSYRIGIYDDLPFYKGIVS